MVGVVAVAIAMMFALGSVSPAMAQEKEVAEVVGEIDEQVHELISAVTTIHDETEVIADAEELAGTELAANAELLHM